MSTDPRDRMPGPLAPYDELYRRDPLCLRRCRGCDQYTRTECEFIDTCAQCGQECCSVVLVHSDWRDEDLCPRCAVKH